MYNEKKKNKQIQKKQKRTPKCKRKINFDLSLQKCLAIASCFFNFLHSFFVPLFPYIFQLCGLTGNEIFYFLLLSSADLHSCVLPFYSPRNPRSTSLGWNGKNSGFCCHFNTQNIKYTRVATSWAEQKSTWIFYTLFFVHLQQGE